MLSALKCNFKAPKAKLESACSMGIWSTLVLWVLNISKNPEEIFFLWQLQAFAFDARNLTVGLVCSLHYIQKELKNHILWRHPYTSKRSALSPYTPSTWDPLTVKHRCKIHEYLKNWVHNQDDPSFVCNYVSLHDWKALYAFISNRR